MRSLGSVRDQPVGSGETCRRILKALPAWFGIPASVEDYVAAAERPLPSLRHSVMRTWGSSRSCEAWPPRRRSLRDGRASAAPSTGDRPGAAGACRNDVGCGRCGVSPGEDAVPEQARRRVRERRVLLCLRLPATRRVPDLVGHRQPGSPDDQSRPERGYCRPTDAGAARRTGAMCRALPVRAPRPAAGPALALLQLLLGPADPAFSGRLLFGVLDPADELVAGQRRDVLPGIESRGVGDQGLAQVAWKLVHHSTGHPRAAQGGHGSGIAAWHRNDDDSEADEPCPVRLPTD